MFVQSKDLSFRVLGNGKYASYSIKGKWGPSKERLADIGIDSVLDTSTGKFIRGYVTLPVGKAKIVTKANGFPRSIFFATRNSNPDLILGRLEEGQPIQEIVGIDNSSSPPKIIPPAACKTILSTYLNAYFEIVPQFSTAIIQHVKRSIN